MPAKSDNQQQAAGMALAAKKGEMDKEDLKGAAKDMYESMSKEELEDYAETSHKDKPENIKDKTSNEDIITNRLINIYNKKKEPIMKFDDIKKKAEDRENQNNENSLTEKMVFNRVETIKKTAVDENDFLNQIVEYAQQNPEIVGSVLGLLGGGAAGGIAGGGSGAALGAGIGGGLGYGAGTLYDKSQETKEEGGFPWGTAAGVGAGAAGAEQLREYLPETLERGINKGPGGKPTVKGTLTDLGKQLTGQNRQGLRTERYPWKRLLQEPKYIKAIRNLAKQSI